MLNIFGCSYMCVEATWIGGAHGSCHLKNLSVYHVFGYDGPTLEECLWLCFSKFCRYVK